MDQLTALLKNAKRYSFWILTAVVVMAGLGTWFYATGSLRAEYEENKSAIESTKSKINAIRAESNHPNDSSAVQMKARIDDITKKVRAAWQTLYLNQANNTLLWPTDLGQDFISRVKPLRPIEAKIDFPTLPSQSLSSNFTERYRDYIKEELPKLAEIIGAQWAPSAGGGSAFGGESGRLGASLGGELGGSLGVAAQQEYLVNWNPTNQAQLQQERFDWSTAPPTTLEVLYAQEDLWVLQTIMKIIARTNGDATAHHRATIKEIESIQMGRNAVGLTGKVQRLQSRGGGDEYYSGSDFGGEGNALSTALPADAREGGAGAEVDPAMYRYVDPQNVPITAEALRDALRTNSSETAFLSVAKRLPIRMRVSMDQRKIHLLLAECGSAPLTIEVRQVRVNREAGSAGGGGSRAGFGRGGEGLGGSGSAAPDASTSYDVPVEIYGVVYIFNPPNDDILKLSESQLAEAAATVNPPVAAPAAPETTPPVAAEPPAEVPPVAAPPVGEPVPEPGAAPAGEPPAAVPAAAPPAAEPVPPAVPPAGNG